MPPKSAPMTQAAIRRMIKESVDAAIATERARQVNVRNDATGSDPVRGRDTAPAVSECTFLGFMKCNPDAFREVKGAVKLRRWFEKTKNVFEISECAEGKKVKFADATLEGPTLTWWKTKVATIGLETVNQMPWTEMKQLMTTEFCPIEEIQRYTRNRCPKKVKQEEIREVHGRAYAIKDTESKGLNVVTGTFLLNNQYAFVLFDSGFDRSFVNTRFSSLLDIKPIKIEDSYEVELADGRIASTNTVKGCTLSLVNHVFEIDHMPIELGTFNVIIGMDWLFKHDVVIIRSEKVVRIPYGNKMLIVEGDKGVSRLKVISSIKTHVPVIRDFPEVFPKELPGLPPPKQV
ncbi:putative reverse transcriptase domain-containing protein [Tanacetum coccineum]